MSTETPVPTEIPVQPGQEPIAPLPMLPIMTVPPTEPPEWAQPEPPTDLVFDDGVPLETHRHRIAMNALIDSAIVALQDNPNSFVGGNMFVYYSRDQAMNRDFRGPDFFVALEVDANRVRQGWVTWEENGRYPNMIIELLSPSTAKVDTGAKKQLYERTFHTAEYYVYDPFDQDSLQGWRLDASQHYQPIAPDDRGWLWCETLDLWLGTWEGRIRREPATGSCTWLRFFDRAGTLVPLPPEVAEHEQQRADQEQQRADQEQQRADQEQQRANQEQQRAERLAARLRELGEDPEEL
jgi:Uma2 family endonuclease